MPAERLTPSTPAPARGIVRLGLGAFFRAGGAICTGPAIAASGGAWAITEVSLQSPGMHDALAPQRGAHMALELGADGEAARRVQTPTGRHDAAAVVHEPFRQWVIDHDFPTGQPDRGAVGAEMVADVTPDEHMKLRSGTAPIRAWPISATLPGTRPSPIPGPTRCSRVMRGGAVRTRSSRR